MNKIKPYSLGLAVLSILVSVQMNAAEAKKGVRIYEYKTTPPNMDPYSVDLNNNVEEKTLLWKSKPGNSFLYNQIAPNSEHVVGPWLGVHVNQVPAIVAAQLGLSQGMGLAVEHVVHGSPASNSGLKKHDILTHFGDQTLVNANQLQVLVRATEVGEEVPLTFIRKGEKHISKAKIITRNGIKSARIKKGNVMTDVDIVIDSEDPVQIHKGAIGTLDLIEKNVWEDAVSKHHSADLKKGVRTSVVLLDNRKLVLSDDSGTYNLTTGNGVKNLVILNPEGNTIFKGELKDDKAFKKLPDDVRKKVEDMLEKSNADHVLRFYDGGKKSGHIIKKNSDLTIYRDGKDGSGKVVEELKLEPSDTEEIETDDVIRELNIELAPSKDLTETDSGI